MTPTGKMTNIAPGKGGIDRMASTLASHHTPGGERGMLRKCLKMKVAWKDQRVNVEIVATNVGHRVPTGFVDRQLILVVTAADENNKQIHLLEGPRLPASTGKWKAVAGALYAKQLIGEARRTPTPFWLPVLNTVDTRLAPDQADFRTFVFAAPVHRVTVQLWYRRFWQEVADARGWTDNDLLVLEQTHFQAGR